MRMYINGVLQYSQNNLTYSALNNDYNFYIGGHGYMLHNGQYVVTDFFDGQMDELRIWNYQKTREEIISLNNTPLDSSYFSSLDSGLVGYWRFDFLEDLGINNDGPDDVRDYSVLHNHLDLAGNAHLVQPDPIIPVELISFVAELRDGKVELIWNTATEVNNHGFEIERSSQGNDWKIVAFIKGKGTTTEIQTYKFIDDLFGASPDKILYRLKQIDLDGQFYYLSEIEVTTLPTNLSLLQNYPNPFNPSTTIKFALPVSSNVKINIYNALGQLVETLVDKEMESGYHQVNIDASKLSSGVYLYQLLVSALHSKDGKAGSFIQTKKMVLIK